MEEKEDVVTITGAEYRALVQDQLLLEALRAAGVDNWDGWDYAIELFQGEAG